MSLLAIILEDLQQARAYTKDLLSNVPDAMWTRQPGEGINPIAWQVGHLSVAQYGLCLKRIRGEQPDDRAMLPEAYLQAFGKGSQPASDPAAYPSPQQLTQVLDAVHDQVLRETERLSEQTLAEPTGPHPMFQAKGGALRFSPKHEMLHAGQIALLRRQFGGESLR